MMFKSDAISKKEFRTISKKELLDNFVFNLFEKDQVKSVYTLFDRVIIIGAIPVQKTLEINFAQEIHANYFLENRELGIINIGDSGIVIADGKKYVLNNKEGIYLGKGTKEILLKSKNEKNPGVFYMMSTPAHQEYPTTLVNFELAKKIKLGEKDNLNKRTIFQLIHPDVLKTCQLSMGITCLEEGSVWNTFPPHTHERRMEIYLYFDVKKDNLIYHFMGEPNETRHVILKNRDAVINPPWSVHFGTGTTSYNFIWGMAGENKIFGDMDQIKIDELQ